VAVRGAAFSSALRTDSASLGACISLSTLANIFFSDSVILAFFVILKVGINGTKSLC